MKPYLLLGFTSLLFCIVTEATVAQPFRFEHLEEIVLPEELQEMHELNYADGKIFHAPMRGTDIYIYDLATEQIVKKFGRQGGGPGEFDMPFIRLHATNDRLIVENGLSKHLFDLDGAFEKKLVSRSPSVLVDAKNLGDGQYLFNMLSSEGSTPKDRKSSYKLGVFDAGTEKILDFPDIANHTPHTHNFLRGYVVDTNSKMVAIAQHGSNKLTYASHEGKPLKTVELKGDPASIEFVKPPELPEPLRSQAIAMGRDVDEPRPSHFIVTKLVMNESYTVILGRFDTKEGLKTTAVIDHATWDVTYHEMEHACLGMHIDGDKMICLTYHDTESRRIQMIKIHRK